MRVAKLIGWTVLLAWAITAKAQQVPAPAAPQVTAPAAPQITPRIVVQAVSAGGFDLAAWTADSRFVFTASGVRRELLLWDVARGVIVDRLRLPSNGKSPAEYMKLHSMALQADQRTLRIEGDVLNPGGTELIVQRAYQVDINTRRISFVRPRPKGASSVAGDLLYGLVRTADALGAMVGVDAMSRIADGAPVLPPLPRSPDGHWGLERAGDGFALVGNDGKRRPMQATQVLASIADADLSPDDRRMAIMTMNGSRLRNFGKTTPVDVIDITSGEILPHVDLPGRYDRVRWVDDFTLAALPRVEGDEGQAGAGLPPVLLIDTRTGTVVGRAPARCNVVVLPGGGLVGARLGACGQGGAAGPGLARLVGSDWQALTGFVLPAGTAVTAMAASPRGDRLALAIVRPGESKSVLIIDAQTGAVRATLVLDDEALVTMLAFSPDGRRVWLAGNVVDTEQIAVSEWLPDAPPGADGKPALRLFPAATVVASQLASRGNHLLIGGAYDEQISVIDLATGLALPSIGFPGAAALGYMRTRPILWAAGTSDGVRLWDQRSGKVLMTISLLPKQRHVVVGADGRYDTNMGPDSENFRWFMPDDPFRSLAPQTLMRDYYEPQLIRKLMDCTAAGNCASVLHPVPPVAALNRQLPEVRITGVTALEPGRVQVSLTINETRDAATGKSSGVFGMKILMNNRQIYNLPDNADGQSRDLVRWRKASLLPADDAAGNRFFTVKLALPTDGEPVEFAAYSFNSDRVKSDTARINFTPPPAPPRPRRAFVLTIGVNDYAERRLQLNFAVPDAQLVAQRLASLPGYEVRRASLTTMARPGGGSRAVTGDHIVLALSLLGGLDVERARERLRAAGHDVSQLEQASPDDVVIISFSGHGAVDAMGNFALLPSDARWPLNAPAPEAASVITMDDLTLWLRAINPRDIAIIIDACHSGAAVATPDFKPGPMGDPGLGQLAFDKGIRILAATQADDVALENASLHNGFLTFALGEGLTPTGGLADLNHDGKVLLDEWLRYAVARLPSLNEEVRRGGGTMAARGVRLMMRAPNAALPRSQEPSLFDFNARASAVVLRESSGQ